MLLVPIAGSRKRSVRGNPRASPMMAHPQAVRADRFAPNRSVVRNHPPPLSTRAIPLPSSREFVSTLADALHPWEPHPIGSHAADLPDPMDPSSSPPSRQASQLPPLDMDPSPHPSRAPAPFSTSCGSFRPHFRLAGRSQYRPIRYLFFAFPPIPPPHSTFPATMHRPYPSTRLAVTPAVPIPNSGWIGRDLCRTVELTLLGWSFASLAELSVPG